jgi:proline dehydrogenase
MLFLSERSWIEDFVTAQGMFRPLVRRFVAGATLDDATQAAAALNQAGLSVTLDHLGEAVRDDRDAATAAADEVRSIDAINADGLDANLSVKLTRLGLSLDRDLAMTNLRRVVEHAAVHGTFVRVDMESSQYTQATLDIVEGLWGEGLTNLGVVTQANLIRSRGDIDRLINLGIRVRLCKGAYLESSGIAIQRKAEVDRNFILLAEHLILDGNYPAIATHDERIISHIIEFGRAMSLDPGQFEFQMLYGVRRDLQSRLRAEGFNVRVYVPFGSDWYRYLTRRLAERPANLLFFAKALMKH